MMCKLTVGVINRRLQVGTSVNERAHISQSEAGTEPELVDNYDYIVLYVLFRVGHHCK
jgi:hypothetical protein